MYTALPACPQFSLTRRLWGFTVSPAADLLHQCLMILPIEGHGAMHQNVQEDSQRPAVHLEERGEGRSAKTYHVPPTGGPPSRSPTRWKMSRPQ